MEVVFLGHLGIGLSAPPRLHALPNPFNLTHSRRPLAAAAAAGGGAKRRHESVSCSASKWADRLLADFHFLPPTTTTTTPSDTSDDHHSTTTTSTATLPPPPPLAPPQRHVSIPIDFYRVCMLSCRHTHTHTLYLADLILNDICKCA